MGIQFKKTIGGRSEFETTGPISEAANNSPIPTPSWFKRAVKWAWRIGPKVADKIGTLEYRTDFETVQEYQEFNATLKIWDENLSTGAVRGYGSIRTTVVEPVGGPYEIKVGRYLEDSYWVFER